MKKPVKSTGKIPPPKKPETEAEWIAACVASFCQNNLVNPKYLSEPTWSLWPGMKVEIGQLVEPEIVSSEFDGKVIVIRCRDKGEKYGQPYDNGFKYGAWPWYDVIPLDTIEQTALMSRPWMHPFSQTSLMGVLHRLQRWGYIDDPDYQRGYVWTEEDRTKLIDSIAAGFPIGGLILRRHKYPENRTEIIDGKQRLNCLLDFVEGRWPWRGKFWYQMSHRDRNILDMAVVSVCEMPETSTKADNLRMFLACNRGGVAQTEEHLTYVQDLYDKELANGKA